MKKTYDQISNFFNNSQAIETKLGSSDPREAIKLIQSLSNKDKNELIAASQKLSSADKLVKLDGYGKVTIDVADKPSRIVFKDTDTARFISGNLGETVTRALNELHTSKPFKEDGSALHSQRESDLLDNKNNTKAELQKIKTSPEYVSLRTSIDEMKSMISGLQTQISQRTAEIIKFNKDHKDEPNFKPKNDSATMKSLSDSITILMGNMQRLDNERVKMIKPAEDASKLADSEYKKLIQSGVTKEKLDQAQSAFKTASELLLQKNEENSARLEILRKKEEAIQAEAELNRLKQPVTLDSIIKPLEYNAEQTKELADISAERGKLLAETQAKETQFIQKKTEYEKLSKKYSEFTEAKVTQQANAYKQEERLAVAKEIIENPALKNVISADFTKAVKSLSDAQDAYKIALEKSTDAITNQTPDAEKLKAEATKLGEKLKLLRADFDKTYSKTLDEVIRITGPESGTGSSGDSKTLSDAFTNLFKKEAGLVQTLPPTTKQQEMSVYVDEATGAFRIGEIYHQDPDYYVKLARESLQQWGDKKTESYVTAEAIKAGVDSESLPEFLRARWCVAAANWGMLKRNLGDGVPDFPTFIRQITEQGFMKPENMELNGPNGGTKAIINTYMQGQGEFKRWNDDKSHPPLPQGDPSNSDSVKAARIEGYQVIADFLKKEQPLAITLRVKDNGSGSGHTISLQRNPIKDGRYTYTVVDGSSSTRVNGTTFDPYNVAGSVLGDPRDPLNDYAKHPPYNFDYIEGK
ncbi:hypothetical protein ND856_09860 [Leptospira bandrabouensis]|uniref:hypothetical protein n=1 Tax=Leptospira bandrabouensis TaxID=2484903 RepID=UPI00223D6ED5|nr:hypothetical protein [Leptospira bandrabouensis]MCW7457672.1 hypothetical protein [Leptospira bandrabouensis]MCW7477588.1 hypothetical protein [Leptospira bandrabouensis]MCW7485270.1 hypothetical protein [Leptospira bandrabouensis]